MSTQNAGINQGAGGSVRAGNDLTNIVNSSVVQIFCNSIAIAICAIAMAIASAMLLQTATDYSTSSPANKPAFRFQTSIPIPHFTGRNQTIQAIQDYFDKLPLQTTVCWDRIVAIVGLGGMGKTEMAYKFAAEFKDRFPNVALINAETESSVLASFRGLAESLGLVWNERQDSNLQNVQKVYLHLDQEDYGNVLFIFDNVIRLNSASEEFGIINYLPSYDLPNQRYPYVLITTQTHDWERPGIQTFRVEELTEEESLEFFRNCFQVESAEFDDLFKNLHQILQGFPLAMNLAASQFDYNPKSDSTDQLRREINNYIDELKKREETISNEEMNPAWPTKYDKTLLNVWSLTFERIQKEKDGPEALELLHLMSFLHVPFLSWDVEEMLAISSDRSHKWDTLSRLRRLIRLLSRFYTVRILKEPESDTEMYRCELGIHRMVQLVVRLQMNSSQDLERVFYYLAQEIGQFHLNQQAVNQVLLRSQMSQRAQLYVGILSCQMSITAFKIDENYQPKTKAIEIIWRLCDFKREMKALNPNATQVLSDLIRIIQSEEQLEDRQLYRDVTIDFLVYFDVLEGGCQTEVEEDLNSSACMEQLVAEFILSFHTVGDLRGFLGSPEPAKREDGLSILTVRLSERFIQAGAPNPTLNVNVITETWIAVLARGRFYYTSTDEMPYFLLKFWEDISEAFHSPNSSQSRIAALRASLWQSGLKKELTQILNFYRRRYTKSSPTLQFGVFLRLVDISMDGLDLRDESVQEVIAAFCQMTATIDTEFIFEDHLDTPGSLQHCALVHVYN